MIFRSVLNQCQTYYLAIPADTLPKMAKSALYSFTVSCLFTKKVFGRETYNIAQPLFAAAVASLASLIYALITPLFNMVFGENRIRLHREFIKQLAVIMLSSLIVNYTTASKVNLFALPLMGSLSINLIKSLLDLPPSIAESWFDDTQLAEVVRDFYTDIGVDVPAGSGSIFLSWNFS